MEKETSKLALLFACFTFGFVVVRLPTLEPPQYKNSIYFCVHKENLTTRVQILFELSILVELKLANGHAILTRKRPFLSQCFPTKNISDCYGKTIFKILQDTTPNSESYI